ncbi:hypothetical protein [Campylobacter aviculae]|uniref:Uncharacterized protein n=1 Tax=Campylobacter aviculae TaxID=2510190 RepID=A0A4U7BIE2_9BACT|nr:hypothetical protein [Campylobacter aviculae]TKX28184.1 hypothetical protein CQA76_08850 [Campylobacter aviculae]
MDKIKEKKAQEFLEKAEGETENLKNKNKKNELIGKYVLIDIELNERLEKFIKEEARRYQTRGFIFNDALRKWLEERGY